MKSETIVGLFVIAAIGIFFYLTFTIGSFRFDTTRYDEYGAYFSDTSGLEVKDPIRIAGVTVGAVKEILLKNDRALVWFWIENRYKLGANTRAVIAQQGLLGNKHIEIDPGDSSAGYLAPGSILVLPSQVPPTIGDLISKFGDIASSVQAVASSLQTSIGSTESSDNLRAALEGFARASERIASFSTTLERTLERNEENITGAIADTRTLMGTLSKEAPALSSGVIGVADQLQQNVLPAFAHASQSVGDVSDKLSGAVHTWDDAGTFVRDGFKEIAGVAEKINRGSGLLGKLVTEDQIYTDIKKTLKGLKSYTDKISAIEVLVDMHSETMLRDWNSKGYCEIRLRTTSDYFYQIQILTDEKGTVFRQRVETQRYDCFGNKLQPPTPSDLYRLPPSFDQEIQTKDATLFGFQFGKRFNRLALRIGVFENTFGLAADWYVPLPTNNVHWISTFEIFDTKGFNRLHDTRPHLKWLNRVYFMRNLYTAFGVDDIVSKHNVNPFFGGGIRFSDNDLKYVLGSLPLSQIAGNGTNFRSSGAALPT